jgi:hypothetical protein
MPLSMPSLMPFSLPSFISLSARLYTMFSSNFLRHFYKFIKLFFAYMRDIVEYDEQFLFIQLYYSSLKHHLQLAYDT